MSIGLTQLLELSNDLSYGRKRRVDWELGAEQSLGQNFAASGANIPTKTRTSKESAGSCFATQFAGSSDIVTMPKSKCFEITVQNSD